MLRHLFTMIWNKKKQNFLLMLEIFISFLVLFAVFTLVVYLYKNYRKPMNLVYENVWEINYNNRLPTSNKDSLLQFYSSLKGSILSIPNVKMASYSNSNTPFSTNTMMNGFDHNGIHVNPNYSRADDDYIKLLNIQLLEGSWFTRGNRTGKDKQVVINRKLKETLFGDSTAVGKYITDPKNGIRVLGVIEDAKMKGDYQDPGYWMYEGLDSSSIESMESILLKLSDVADEATEAQIYKFVANAMKDSNIEIVHLSDKLKTSNNQHLIPTIILSIVAGFLTINVALGMFGVLWYNINKRKTEIGLRRAVGASAGSVKMQLVLESLLIATLAIAVGSFFAIQFPLLNVFDLPAAVYLMALLLAIAFIYLLVLICSFYPGKQAAAIYPAIALHEE